MSLKRLLLVILLATLSSSNIMAQTSRGDAREAIALGNKRYARAEYESAIEEYRRVPQSAGEIYAQSLYNIGVCYYELWRTEEAVAFYRRAIEARKGRYPKALYALGVALKDLGRLSEAKEAYRQSIAVSGGKNAEAHFMLGLLAMGEGDGEAAVALLREAIARSKDHFPASHNNLGVVLARMGRLSEAEREFEVALRQAGGVFDEAAQNLKLCRSLLAAAPKAQLASFKIIEKADAAVK